jgi:hypothetical protein
MFLCAAAVAQHVIGLRDKRTFAYKFGGVVLSSLFVSE